MSEPAAASDGEVSIAALRACGAHRHDPVRFHYLEALARRSATHAGDLRCRLDQRLVEALALYRAQYETARSEAGARLAATAAKFPDDRPELERLFAAGDFTGLGRLLAAIEHRGRRDPLAELVRQLDRAASGHEAAAAPDKVARVAAAPVELKALRDARHTWAKLSTDRQMSQSQAKAPENPGPINSHLLVLRSLKLMQDIAPDYLQRCVSYVDTLLWLDGASGASALPTPGASREGDKKRKPGRAKPA